MHSTIMFIALTALFATRMAGALFVAPTGAPLLRRQFSNLPPCVQTCLGQAMAATSACAASEFNCLCHTQRFIDGAGNCYIANCSPSDAQAGIDFGTSSCNAIGVSISFTPTATAAGGATSGAGSAPASIAPSASSSASAVASSAASRVSSSVASTSAAKSAASSASASASSAAANSPAQAVTAHGLAAPVVGLGLVTLYLASVIA